MKKPQNIADIAAELSAAASAPLVPPTDTPTSRKRGSVAVFLKVPPDRHAKLDYEAVSRTKETGKGVTVQQVILEKLEKLEKLENAQ